MHLVEVRKRGAKRKHASIFYHVREPRMRRYLMSFKRWRIPPLRVRIDLTARNNKWQKGRVTTPFRHVVFDLFHRVKIDSYRFNDP